MNDNHFSMDVNTELSTKVIPILPMFETTLFPKMILPLSVVQKDSIKLIDEAMSKDRIVGFLVSKEQGVQNGYTQDDLFKVGTFAVILKMAKTENNTIQLMVQGLGRFRVEEFIEGKSYLQAQIEVLEDQEVMDKETKAMMSNVLTLYNKIVGLSPGLPQEIGSMAKSIEEPGTLADMITSTINTSHLEKQKILEIKNVKERLKKVTKLVNYQLEILEIGTKIQSQVKEDMSNKQREYFLRQQLKAIQEELGETDETSVEIEEYRAKIVEKDMPEEAVKEAERELKRLGNMHPSSSEYTVASTYLDWITSLPWNKSTKDTLELKNARKILDEDHFGLEKAKKRILEFLAVRKLKPDSKGSILCFAGPPGTGKTSLGRSIARSMGREFIRIALGGIRDEAEIRGHRRTYVGAMPGRIIQGLRRAESNNPVFILDEIDKVGSDFRGDPSSALLEVLDPQQNSTFTDHYLDVAFDLSNVMFITTANMIYTIPPALLDRMEVLELSGYTIDEKIKIATKYLIPRQREEHGLSAGQMKFSKAAIKQIVTGYTREAGLRNFEREIANICRGVASKIAEDESKGENINAKDLHEYLGKIKFTSETSSRIKVPGVVMGLAWTASGGELLFIEATAMKGNKSMILTGQLGNVMKESVSTALSFIRSNAKRLKIDDMFMAKHDIHVHVPAGAIPKDGPSAGVTMLTALVSLMKNKLVKKDLAMSGEITLRGRVLAVGGVKEKILAAHRAGIKTIILPKWNERDLEEIPDNVKETVTFHFVDDMIEVLEIAFAR